MRGRIAVDLTSLLDPPTGVTNVLRRHLDGLGERTGTDVVGFAASWRGRDRLPSAVPAGSVDRLVRRPAAARPLRRSWLRWDRPRIEWWTGRVDAVWGPNFVVPPARAGTARLATVHDLTCIRHPEMCTADVLQYPPLLRRAAAAGAHFHVVSRFVADELVDALAVPADRVHVVRNGVDAAPPGDAARGQALAGAERYVLTIGTVEPRKDHRGLVRAFDALGERDDVHLVIAGADGWGADALAAALAASPAARAGRVRRLGYVSDGQRADLLAGATVLAYPSVYEGFGLPPVEAMAAGTPVVATVAGALPEVLGGAADLVPVGDADALAAGLARVLDDDAHRADLVRLGASRAAELTWDEPLRDLAALLVDLAASP